MSERSKDIELSIRTARLWQVGKMIGGDEDAVRNDLLGEVDRLEAELAALRAELAAMKGEDHADRCAQSKRLKAEATHWHETAKRLEAELAARKEAP